MKTQKLNGVRSLNNLLLIDDDTLCSFINEKILKTLKFAKSVKSFPDAKEALEYLRNLVKTDITKLPEVVLLDINMPGMNGWEFLDELNEFPQFILSGCKVVMLTSSIDQRDIEKSKSYKMVHSFISKPLTGDKLEMLFPDQYDPAIGFKPGFNKF